ncbi:MAG: hypothetical protein R3261_14855, partial [Alphaproteobacteria bacterium]|nr:hypothetical protein [Alphaproteobacteria bacterium]
SGASGGTDIFYGNGGNDTFTLNHGSFRSSDGYFDGGEGGADVLVLGSGSDLDFGLHQVNRIEVLDITNGAAISQEPTIKLTADHILAFTEDTNSILSGKGINSNALIVNGGLGQSLDLTGFTQGSTESLSAAEAGSYSGSYTIYSDATSGTHVYVHSNISVTGLP